MNKYLKIFLFITFPVWFLPVVIGAIIKLLYEEFDGWIDPKNKKEKPKFWNMTNYD